MSSWASPCLTWLITGASSGMGLALSRLALANGHKVIGTSRNPARDADLVADFEKRGGKLAALDLDSPSCASLIEDLENQGTAIDVLVNMAGYALLGVSETFSEDEVHRQMETVYFGPYRLIRAALPHMRKRRQEMIVNVGSGAGFGGRESMGIYGASKAAMDRLIHIMGKEVTPYNIRTLTVYLGGFDTEFSSKVTIGEAPLPEDYQGSVVEKTLGLRTDYIPDGDHHKAVKAMYEVILGEGVGAGKEAERAMPLGRDMARVWESQRVLTAHAMDTFGDICNNVYISR